ncbi:MAG: signal peptidase II [Parasphingorhabdus sp.]|jgi:signal peptidase II
MTLRCRALGWFTIIASCVAVIDQLSKYYTQFVLGDGNAFEVTSFLNFVVVYNRGAAFGFLNQQGGWQIVFFATIALLVLAYLIHHIWHEAYQSRLLVIGYSFIAGGAIGNLTDRLIRGSVLDFIDVHWQTSHFWVFNLADAALTLGVSLIIVSALLGNSNFESSRGDESS